LKKQDSFFYFLVPFRARVKQKVKNAVTIAKSVLNKKGMFYAKNESLTKSEALVFLIVLNIVRNRQDRGV